MYYHGLLKCAHVALAAAEVHPDNVIYDTISYHIIIYYDVSQLSYVILHHIISYPDNVRPPLEDHRVQMIEPLLTDLGLVEVPCLALFHPVAQQKLPCQPQPLLQDCAEERRRVPPLVHLPALPDVLDLLAL